jgi:Tol biopolymer transport system component
MVSDGNSTVIAPEVRAYGAPRISPDGKTIAVSVTEQGNSALWLYDLGNKTFSRLSDIAGTSAPSWSSDGRVVYYAGLDDQSNFALWSQPIDGGTPPLKLVVADSPIGAVTASPDGKSLIYLSYQSNSWNLFKLALGPGAKPEPYVITRADEYSPMFSPDGKWVAMVVSETTSNEVVIRAYPDAGPRIQVSAGNGSDPVWSKDGTSIYYRAGAVLIRAHLSQNPNLRVTGRDTVVKAMNAIATNAVATQYDLSRDGRILGRLGSRRDYELVVVPNWRVELERKLAASRH